MGRLRPGKRSLLFAGHSDVIGKGTLKGKSFAFPVPAESIGRMAEGTD
jgi:hypothetical protein